MGGEGVGAVCGGLEAHGHLPFGGLKGDSGIVVAFVRHINFRCLVADAHLAQRVALAELQVGAVHEALVASLNAHESGLGNGLASGSVIEYKVL